MLTSKAANELRLIRIAISNFDRDAEKLAIKSKKIEDMVANIPEHLRNEITQASLYANIDVIELDVIECLERQLDWMTTEIKALELYTTSTLKSIIQKTLDLS